MNYMRAGLWLMVALFVSHAPYGEASLRQSLAFVPSSAFFWLSCHSPFHVLFVFGAGLMSDVWTGAPFGSHGVMFAWMMMMARSPLARAGMIARVLAFVLAVLGLVTALSLMGYGAFVMLWQSSMYALIFFSVMMIVAEKKDERRYRY